MNAIINIVRRGWHILFGHPGSTSWAFGDGYRFDNVVLSGAWRCDTCGCTRLDFQAVQS